LWNNAANPAARYRYAELWQSKWQEKDRYPSDRGTLPGFKAFAAGGDVWQLALAYGETAVLDLTGTGSRSVQGD
jgi:hypothetical protein